MFLVFTMLFAAITGLTVQVIYLSNKVNSLENTVYELMNDEES